MTERLLTVKEAAVATGETERTIRRWIDEDILPVERVGPLTLKRVRIRLSVLTKFYPIDVLHV